MNNQVRNILHDALARHPHLQDAEDSIIAAYAIMVAAYKQGGKLLICGNGGSAADADHIVGELMKGFLKKRPVAADIKKALFIAGLDEISIDSLQMGLPAINLSAHTSLITATTNDLNGELIFAQQVIGYGKPGDVFLGISTSGNAKNVLLAGRAAKALGLKTVGLTGLAGGKIGAEFDLIIRVKAEETYKVQELHLPVYHALCAMIEEEFFGTC